jgi:hypothetical protein
MRGMAFWLDLSAPPVETRHGSMTAFTYPAPTGVDSLLYMNLVGVSNQVADRVTRCFAGSAWLRRRFPARSYVQVHLLPRNDASVDVEYLRTHSWSEDGAGPQEIQCGLRIPMAWLAEPGAALLGLRVFQAVLHALHAIGNHYGIGTPTAIGPNADRGNPEVSDPFSPPPPAPSYTDINAHLERLTASLKPEQLLLAVKEPTSSTIAGQCRNVSEALGSIIEQHTLTTPNAKATAWLIQTRL